jgi:hypothetical protein
VHRRGERVRIEVRRRVAVDTAVRRERGVVELAAVDVVVAGRARVLLAAGVARRERRVGRELHRARRDVAVALGAGLLGVRFLEAEAGVRVTLGGHGVREALVTEALVVRFVAEPARCLERAALGRTERREHVLAVGRLVAGQAVLLVGADRARAEHLEVEIAFRLVAGGALELSVRSLQRQVAVVIRCLPRVPGVLAVARSAGDRHASLVGIVVAARAVLVESEVAALAVLEHRRLGELVALGAVELEVLAGHVVADAAVVERSDVRDAGEREARGVDHPEIRAVVLAVAELARAGEVGRLHAVQTRSRLDLRADVLVALEAATRHVADPAAVARRARERAGQRAVLGVGRGQLAGRTLGQRRCGVAAHGAERDHREPEAGRAEVHRPPPSGAGGTGGAVGSTAGAGIGRTIGRVLSRMLP